MTVCFSAVLVKLMLKCSHYGAVRSKLNVTIFRDSTCSQFDGAVHREKLLSARLQTNFRLTLITQVGDPGCRGVVFDCRDVGIVKEMSS